MPTFAPIWIHIQFTTPWMADQCGILSFETLDANLLPGASEQIFAPLLYFADFFLAIKKYLLWIKKFSVSPFSKALGTSQKRSRKDWRAAGCRSVPWNATTQIQYTAAMDLRIGAFQHSPTDKGGASTPSWGSADRWWLLVAGRGSVIFFNG